MSDEQIIESFIDNVMPTLPHSEGMVWLQVFRHWRESGECRLSQSEIAERSGLSVRTVRRAVRNLEGKGFIEVKQRGRHGAFSNAYIIRPEKVLPDTSGR